MEIYSTAKGTTIKIFKLREGEEARVEMNLRQKWKRHACTLTLVHHLPKQNIDQFVQMIGHDRNGQSLQKTNDSLGPRRSCISSQR